MLASPAGTLPPLKGWTIEPKWDGIRVIAEVGAAGVSLWSRNNIDKSDGFPGVSAELQDIARRAEPMILDGELIAVDSRGKPLRFQAFQARHLRPGALPLS